MNTILIAEDEQFLANAYRVKFEKDGYLVHIVSSGSDVLQKAKEVKPNIILLDLLMPHKDGFAVLEELKKDEECKNIPVIIASNLSQKEDVDKCMALGAVDFYIKSDTPLQTIVDKVSLQIKK